MSAVPTGTLQGRFRPFGAAIGSLFARGLKRNASLSLAAQASATALTMVTGILLARELGPAEYGLWAASLAGVGILSTFAVLGLPNLVTSRLAAHYALGELPQMQAVARAAGRLAFAAGFALACAGWVWCLSVRGPYSRVFAVACLALPLMAYGLILAAKLQGVGHALQAQFGSAIVRPLVLLAAVLSVTGFRSSLNGVSAMGINVLATVVSLIYLARAGVRLAPEPVRTEATVPWIGLLRDAAPFLVISASAMVGARVDLIIIASLLDSRAVGLYEVAARGADVVLLPLAATATILAPEFARRRALRDQEGLQRLATLSCRGIFFLALPAAVVLIAAPRLFITLLFGAAYVDAAGALSILAGGYAAILAMGPLHILLCMTGHGRYSAVGTALAVVLGIGLSLALIPYLGIEGSAIARGISQLLAAMWLALVVRRRLDLRTTLFSRLDRRIIPHDA